MFKVSAFLLLVVAISFVQGGIFSSATKLSCGGQTSSKTSILESPASAPKKCTYQLNAHSSYVCQLRIEFDLDLAQPTIPSSKNTLKYPECEDDYFQVGDFRFCGQETNQHIYIPFNRTDGIKAQHIEIKTAVRAGGSNLLPPSWNIRVIQLECPKGSPVRSMPIEAPQARSSFDDGFLIAPVGCTQYFPEASGDFQSFNYNNGKGTYSGNLNYAICFRRTTGTKKLQLNAQGFSMGYSPTVKGQIDQSCFPEVASASENEDYLEIPAGSRRVGGQTIRATYYCGESLSKQAIESNVPGPLSLVFHSDKFYDPAVPEKGFSFTYNVI